MTEYTHEEAPETAREIPDAALLDWRDDPTMYRDRYESAIEAAIYAREDLDTLRAERDELAARVGDLEAIVEDAMAGSLTNIDVLHRYQAIGTRYDRIREETP